MISAKPPQNEAARLKKLKELNIMDTLEEQAYDDLTQLAAHICDAPIALVSLIDESRQWFKSHHGLEATETPRDLAFCAHAILQEDLFVIEDADKDERFHDNPLVTDEPHVKFYAGAPLVLDGEFYIGTLCVIDHHARQISDEQRQALRALSRQVISQLELRLKVKELKELDHAKDEFLSMVSHELRTPLTSIKGSLAVINHMSTLMDEQSRSMLDIAVRNSDQLLVIVNDILDLAKMEAGKLDMEFSKIDLVEMLQQAVNLNKNYIEQCACNIVLKLPDNVDSFYILADKQRLIQVVSNLLSNAAKFSPKNSDIELILEVSRNNVRISVVDSGSGIPEEYQAQLFQKFKQLGKTENQKLPGTGLGLNICKHIIEAHHGNIGFESVPGEKTVFYFTLDINTHNESDL